MMLAESPAVARFCTDRAVDLCRPASVQPIAPLDMKVNQLYYGDNLSIMERMDAQSVDLIYLDPPFNSQQSYNLLYRTLTGKPVPDQADAFFDTWEMQEAQWRMLDEMPVLVHRFGIESQYGELWKTWLYALRDSQPKLLAYLLYMLRRFLQMRVLLKPTGSIFLHCDPTASHYLKVLMDGVFGHDNFRNEIIWRRTGSHNSARRFGPVHDVILFYSKSDRYTWNGLKRPYMRGHVEKAFVEADGRHYTNYSGNVLNGSGRRNGESGKPWRGFDPDAKNRHWAIPKKITLNLPDEFKSLTPHQKLDYLHERGRITIKPGDEWPRYKHEVGPSDGQPISDIWAYQPYTEGTVYGTEAGIDDDVRWMGTKAGARLGYETQKPTSLLKRIISASSKENDIVFDPFCGCGTTIYAAHLTGRRWVGCDIAILAVNLVKDTLHKRYRLTDGTDFHITGIPVSVEQAGELFKEQPTQFQHWAVERIGGFPMQRKSADRGIDGRLYYETKGSALRAMVLQVKGGHHIGPSDIRDLRGVLEREQDADLAGFICMKEPTKAMRIEASEAGSFDFNGVTYPRIQMLTVAQILEQKLEFRSPSKVSSRVSTGQVNLPYSF